MKRLRSLLILLLPLACSSTTGPADVSHPEFVAALANTAGAPSNATSPPTVHVSPGRIDVDGILPTPTPCYDLTAELGRADRRLTLTVTARDRGGVCIQVLANFAYAAKLDGLESGLYQLTVEHAYEDARGEIRRTVTVLVESVAVP